MKKSNYNIFINKKNFTICYNSLSDSYLVISNEAYNAFKVENLTAFQRQYPDIYSNFIEYKFIISEEVNELINQRMVEKLKEINPMFQITLDGYRDKHDQVRIGKQGNFQTYDRIIKAIHYIVENINSKHEKISRILTIRINYDNQTLKDVDKILEDINDLDRNKIFIHFERVWQTKDMVNEEQRELLRKATRLCIINGFSVGHGIFGKRYFSCPADTFQYAIINYDGLVYKCNGRNITKNNNEGYLNEEGEIIWNENKLIQRLGKSTFENPMCLSCKILPVCMGPCSQKNIDNNWENLERVCALNAIDISLEEYLSFEFEVNYYYKKQREII
jgi:uncharacterized protein